MYMSLQCEDSPRDTLITYTKETSISDEACLALKSQHFFLTSLLGNNTALRLQKAIQRNLNIKIIMHFMLSNQVTHHVTLNL